MDKVKKGIIIIGPSAAGKSTIGKMLAVRLGVNYIDVDEYIWSDDSSTFLNHNPHNIIVQNILAEIDNCDYFVMSDVMSNYHSIFDSFFEYCVFVDCDAQTCVERADKRAYDCLGDEIRSAGEKKAIHEKYLNNVLRYETDGVPNRTEQMAWCDSLRGLGCRVVTVDGKESVEKNIEFIINFLNDSNCNKK